MCTADLGRESREPYLSRSRRSVKFLPTLPLLRRRLSGCRSMLWPRGAALSAEQYCRKPGQDCHSGGPVWYSASHRTSCIPVSRSHFAGLLRSPSDGVRERTALALSLLSANFAIASTGIPPLVALLRSPLDSVQANAARTVVHEPA